MTDYTQFYQALRRHVDFDEEELRLFRSITRKESIPKKVIVYKPDEPNDDLIYILKGVIKSFIFTEDGNEIILNFHKEDWWGGDLGSYYLNKTSRIYYKTLEDCEILMISRKEMTEMTEKYPRFEKFFHKLLIHYTIALQERFLNQLSLPAKRRYEMFTDRYPDIVQRVPQKMIASYLGITPEFMSKMRGMK